MKPFFRFWWFVVQRFFYNDNRKTAADLTYTSLFALVPLITATYIALTALPIFSEVADDIQSFIFAHFIPSSGEVVEKYLLDFSQQARKLTAVGLILLFISAISLMHGLEEAFNQIWRVKTRRIGRRLILYWLVMFLTPISMALIFLVGSYLMSTSIWMDHIDGVFNINRLLIDALPWLMSIMTLTTIYYFIPTGKVYFWQALLGGVLATAILDLSQWGFVTMVASMPNYKIVYGAFAAIPLFLIWLFLVWLVILFVAEVIRALPYIRQSTDYDKRSDLDWALQILSDLSQQKTLNQQDYTGCFNLAELEAFEHVLNLLIDAGWIESQDGELILMINIEMKTVGELSDIIHAKRLSGIALTQTDSPWYKQLSPRLLELKEEKQRLLQMPISSVI